jgi:hypothetical protein
MPRITEVYINHLCYFQQDGNILRYFVIFLSHSKQILRFYRDLASHASFEILSSSLFIIHPTLSC